MVAHVLLSYLFEGIERLLILELVYNHHIGEIEHIDLFQLRRRSVF